MKLYLSLFLLLAPLWSEATVQITVEADIAPQVSVASYIVVQSGACYMSGNCNQGAWSDSMGYAFSESFAGGTNLDFNGVSSGTYAGPTNCFFSACGGAIVPVCCEPPGPPFNPLFKVTESGTALVLDGYLLSATITGTTNSGMSPGPFTNTDVGLQWGWENANYSASAPLPLQGGSENMSRTIVTTLKLKTGGGAGSKLRNVFGMYASIQQVAPEFVQMCGFPPDAAAICGMTAMTNGPVSIQTNWLQVFPDNANVVISPPASNLSDYTFNVSPTKYNCYFDIFVEPAALWPLESGHAFCRFRTDAPTYALQFISTNLTGFLNQCEGFYPDNNNDLYGHPGQMQQDNMTSYYFVRSFYIGFPDLLNGLAFMREIKDNPPTYNFGIYDCVNFAATAGWDAGINNMSPLDSPGVVVGDVARNLSRQYPGPWINDPIIYFP